MRREKNENIVLSELLCWRCRLLIAFARHASDRKAVKWLIGECESDGGERRDGNKKIDVRYGCFSPICSIGRASSRSKLRTSSAAAQRSMKERASITGKPKTILLSNNEKYCPMHERG